MNSDQLRQFKAIAECGSLTKAAERLYISQSALSMSLTKLEDEIGKLLFVRKGRQLEITENGETLLKYANIVVQTIQDAEDYFRVPEGINDVLIYRIGGVGMPLLMSGSYKLTDYRLKVQLVHNWEMPQVVGQSIAEFIIADERYMNISVYKGVEKVFLYRQKLLLAVRGDDPLAQRDEIDVEELENLSLIGRTSTLGFNDWLEDVMRDNRCKINEALHSDYIFYANEGQHIPNPYLMSSFGLSVAKGTPSFANRKTLVVKGKYTERDIYLWYDNRIKRQIQPYIDLIKGNAQRICAADEQLEDWPQLCHRPDPCHRGISDDVLALDLAGGHAWRGKRRLLGLLFLLPAVRRSGGLGLVQGNLHHGLLRVHHRLLYDGGFQAYAGEVCL